MKTFTMRPNQILLLAGLSLSSFLFSCDKENIMPATPGSPTTGTPPPTNPTTPPPVTPPTPNNPTTPPVTTSSLLTQLGTKVLQYDAQNRLTAVSYTDQAHHGYTVVYEGDRPVRLNFNTGNYMLYTYQGNKVVEAVRYYGENLVNYRHTFEYSGDKLVKETTMSYTVHDEGRLGLKEFRYDANGNLTELVTAWSTSNRIEDLGSASVIRWGDYDDKPNPMPYAEAAFYLPGVKLFHNNPGYREPGTGKELYTYLYHASGMPKQRSTKLEAYPQVPAHTDSYTYK